MPVDRRKYAGARENLPDPALRISFQRACYDAFPDLRAKMDVEADEAAGQDGNMVFLPVWD